MFSKPQKKTSENRKHRKKIKTDGLPSHLEEENLIVLDGLGDVSCGIAMYFHFDGKNAQREKSIDNSLQLESKAHRFCGYK